MATPETQRPRLEYGMLRTQLLSVSPAIKCQDRRCHRMIAPGGEHFFDTLHDRVYCDDCGKCLRYARKKAAQRGDPPPETLED